ncbi:YfiT family bacillithiol transferase [Spirosoma foliorum]|uniref:DinB family protein n=1 Tax=Spirosoma foliorum TaxID=2710596 RepID=A0A7G5GYJ5_9BACT|nr:DinB family protein [Spirosoma foliorum]QMW03937.1 DinB family protein [Spirosoma foliorum]
MDDRKFPIGPFVPQDTYSTEELAQLIKIIENSPAAYRELVENLSTTDLAKTYREGSWTVQQLVHHVADIQFVHFLRMKKALTEPDYKVLTLIDMNAWAHTPDATEAPIDDSLVLLDGVTRRYVYLTKSLTEPMLAISYFHPVRQIMISQAQALAMTAWHVQHHLAHIKLALS